MSDPEILKKLDIIIALLATQGKEDQEKLQILKTLGFTFREISNFTAIPEGTLKTWDFKKRKLNK